MEADNVQGRYQLYKAGTTKVLRWLASTAGTVCDLRTDVKAFREGKKSPSSADVVISTKKGRFKRRPIERGTSQQTPGQSNVTKSNAAKKPSTQSKGPSQINVQYQLTSQEILRLAEVIASARPVIEIPSDIFSVLQDVISARSACADWYTSHSIQQDKERGQKNEGHAHFIEILRQVRDVLRTAKQSQAKDGRNVDATETEDASKEKPLNNLFEALELEEPRNNPLGSATTRLSSCIPDGDVAALKLVADRDEQSAREFEVWCLLEDMNDLRSLVRKTWLEYVDGRVSLVLVGTLTDTAFGLMRRANSDFVTRYPELDDYWSLRKSLGITMPDSHVTFSSAQFVSMREERDETRPTEMLCSEAATSLKMLKDELIAFHRMLDCDLMAKATDSLHALHASGKCHDFFSGLLPLLHIIACLAKNIRTARHDFQWLSPADEFLNGLMEFSDSVGTTTWFVVACQTYQDIFDAGMRHRMGRAAIDIVKHLKSYASSVAQLDSLFKLPDDEPSAIPWDCYSFVTQDVLRFLDWITLLKSPPNDKSVSHFREHSLSFLCLTLIPILPVMPCKMIYILKANLLCNSIEFVNDCLGVVSLAHFYRAARSYGLITKAWEDMDFVIAQHNSKHPYVTTANPNADVFAIARHYHMALGVPASSLLGKGAGVAPDPLTVVKKARRLSHPSDFMSAMANAAEFCFHPQPATPNTVDIVLYHLSKKVITSHPAGKNASRSHSQPSPTPIHLLSTFKETLKSEEPQLNFDYIRFSITCTKILNCMGDILFGDNRDVAFEQRRSYQLVSILLCGAADTINSGKTLKGTQFAIVAEYLEAVVKESGNIYTQNAFEQSSGHIQEHLRPNAPKATSSDSSPEPDTATEDQLADDQGE